MFQKTQHTYQFGGTETICSSYYTGPSRNPPANDAPSSGVVPVNRGKSFHLALCFLLSFMVDLLRRTTRPPRIGGDPHFGLLQLEILEQ